MKIFYCDGSTRGKNQKGADNVGGFGVVQFYDEDENHIEWTAQEESECTTNNREELKALIAALERASALNEKCIIYCDSAYAVNSFNVWIHSWASNNWKNSKKQTVENLDLILELWEYAKQEWPNYSVEKTEGHVGIIGNELADCLARDAWAKFNIILMENGISCAV